MKRYNRKEKKPCPWCGRMVEPPPIYSRRCEYCGKKYTQILSGHSQSRGITLLFFHFYCLAFLGISIWGLVRTGGRSFIYLFWGLLASIPFIFGVPYNFSRIYDEKEGKEKDELCEAKVLWTSPAWEEPTQAVYTAEFEDPVTGLPCRETAQVCLNQEGRGPVTIRYGAKAPVENRLIPGCRFCLYDRDRNVCGTGVVMSDPGKASDWVLMEIWWAGEERARDTLLSAKALDMTGEETGTLWSLIMGYAHRLCRDGDESWEKYEVCLLNPQVPFEEISLKSMFHIYDGEKGKVGTGRVLDKYHRSLFS